jgi:hypothetical protein
LRWEGGRKEKGLPLKSETYTKKNKSISKEKTTCPFIRPHQVWNDIPYVTVSNLQYCGTSTWRALVPRRVEKSETAADPGPVERGARSPSIIIVPASVGESRTSRCINCTVPTVSPFCARLSSCELVKRPPLVAPPLPLSLSLCPQQKNCVCKLESHPTKWAFHSGPESSSDLPEFFPLAHWCICVYATFAITVRPRKKVKFGCTRLYFGLRSLSTLPT